MVSSVFKKFGILCFINQFLKKYHRLALSASDRKDLRYQLEIGFFIIPYTKWDLYWSFWCQGWSYHQDEEKFWGNRAVEAVEASEVAEADEVNEAAEVSKGSKITTEDFRIIQVLEFSLFWCYFDVLKKNVLVESWKFMSNSSTLSVRGCWGQWGFRGWWGQWGCRGF